MDAFRLKDEDIQKTFPAIWRYLEDPDVTDLDYNCGNIWQSRVEEIPIRVVDSSLTEKDWENFSALVGKSVNCNFNPREHTAMADTQTLRITCLHKSQSKSGSTNVNIRKSHGGLRISRSTAIESGYCSEEIMNMLENCVRAYKSIVFCGIPASGKTECLKLFASVIPKHEKVITIEDVAEIHYPLVNPGASCAELKVVKGNYSAPVETALRMNARRLLMGEIRSENDMEAFLECVSNGIPIMTTTHTNDARLFPDRGVNLLHDGASAERVKASLYSYVDISVLLKLRASREGKIKRYIDQVCFFFRDDTLDKNYGVLVVDEGKLYKDRIPNEVRARIEEVIGHDMFQDV